MCKRHVFVVYLALLLAVGGSSAALAGTVYNFQLVGDGAVIAREGADTGYPSVIRVPSWIPSNERAAANANYYMYYGNHSGNRIRMKWAETLDGTWTEFNLGGTYNGKSRQGVFDPYADETRDSYDHIFSGDVHVDDVNERIIIYFHAKNQGPTYTMEDPPYTKIWKRHLQGFVATSHYGLNFNDPDYAGGEPGHGPVTHSTDGPTREVLLAETYMRVFESRGRFSAISKGGIMSQAPDPLNPWAPHPTLPYKEPAWNEARTAPFGDFMTSSAFANHSKNPVPGDRIVDDGDGQRLNHVGINLLPGGTQLEVFSYAANDADYKDIYRVIYNISDPDFNSWVLATDGGEVIFDVVVTASEIREAVEAAHPGGVDTANYADPVHISDPTIFVDDDGSKYMFYSYRSATQGGNNLGEGQISAVKLIPVTGGPAPVAASTFNHATLGEENRK